MPAATEADRNGLPATVDFRRARLHRPRHEAGERGRGGKSPAKADARCSGRMRHRFCWANLQSKFLGLPFGDSSWRRGTH